MVDPLRVAGIGSQPLGVGGDLSVSGVGAPQLRPARPAPLAGESVSFKDVLNDTVNQVQQLQNDADATIKQLVSGEIKDVTQAMVAVEKADMAFQTMITVRNKIVAAYEEIMRMQV